MITYAILAIAFLVGMLVLLRTPAALRSDEALGDREVVPSPGNARWLDLSERIFDPADARWLEEELAFPKLAKVLVTARKRLAIRWLQALQASFDHLVRTPETAEAQAQIAVGSWKMLWLTLRFKLLVSYALLVVRVFGPYHRLIPSFSWVPLTQAGERSFRRAALAEGRSVH